MDEKNISDEEIEAQPELEIEEIEKKLENKLAKIKKQLKECEKQKAEYLAGWQRTKADFINARKGEEKNREQIINLHKEELLKQFLVVADAFEAAFKDGSWNKLNEKWRKGIEAVFTQLKKILEQYNVKPYDAAGEKFDPEKHEALKTIEVNEKEKDQIILEEFQKGYNINDKILRPAKVMVGVYKNEVK